MASNIGMMDGAYFVGRNEILTWINNCLQLNLSRIEEHIEVNKLVKARPLDNLEFLQWLKRYCDSVNGGIMNENYNPIERRSKVGKDRCRGSLKAAKSLQANNTHQSSSVDSGPKHVKGGAAAGGSSMDIQALSTEVTDLKLSVDLLEKERDFYFAKLRDIEILCQIPELETIPVAVAIKKILYAADAKESALEEAQEYLAEALNNGEEADEEA
ncbi:Microtubule-associated protein RP/EB family member 1B [Linum perenne]